jgi:RNA polymerase sigma-70 factor (ECF subfamily)
MAFPISDAAAILDRYERPLIRYAVSILGDLDAARDIVQETFIAWAEGRGPKESGEQPVHGPNGATHLETEHVAGGGSSPVPPEQRHLEAWLFTVCRNRAIDHQRKQSRIIPMHPIDDRTSDEPNPAALLEKREMAGSLVRLLDKLSANQREVIRLKFQNDLSYKEIAEITQLSVTNVGFLLHTGAKKTSQLYLGTAW